MYPRLDPDEWADWIIGGILVLVAGVLLTFIWPLVLVAGVVYVIHVVLEVNEEQRNKKD